MLKVFLWLRYLRKKKIVILSILAVALSVALLICVNSIFTGFIDAIKKHHAAESGDFIIISREGIAGYSLLSDRLEQLPEVSAAAPIDWRHGLLRLQSGDVREVRITGIHPAKERKFKTIQTRLLRRGILDANACFDIPDYNDVTGGWLGVNLVAEPNERTDQYDLEELNELIGRQVVLTTFASRKDSSENTNDPKSTMKRKVIPFRISDIAFTDTYHGDNTVFLPFETVSALQYGEEKSDHARYMKIRLADNANADLVEQKLRTVFIEFCREDLKLPPGDCPDIQIRSNVLMYNQNYFIELNKQKSVLMLIFSVICSVSILLIFCIFYMIVDSKQKDIAIIKSCGTGQLSVVSIYLAFGASVGMIGSGVGVLFSYIITRNINELERMMTIIFGLKLWRSSSYILNFIPNTVNWSAVLPIVAAAVVGSVIGALLPAVIAARMKPVELLRYE